MLTLISAHKLTKTKILKYHPTLLAMPKYHSSSQVLNIKNYYDSITTLTNEIQTKTHDIMEMSFDASLNRMIEMVKITEQKIKTEKLNDVDINVSMNVGPISVTINKKILLE